MTTLRTVVRIYLSGIEVVRGTRAMALWRKLCCCPRTGEAPLSEAVLTVAHLVFSEVEPGRTLGAPIFFAVGLTVCFVIQFIDGEVVSSQMNIGYCSQPISVIFSIYIPTEPFFRLDGSFIRVFDTKRRMLSKAEWAAVAIPVDTVVMMTLIFCWDKVKNNIRVAYSSDNE